MNNLSIKVYNPNYWELFSQCYLDKGTYIYKIPTYQRPYIWSSDKVKRMIADFKDYLIPAHDINVDYFMGSIILHQDEDGNLNIVDGQQRLTTLIIIDRVWNGNNSALVKYSQNLNFEIHTKQAQRLILQAKKEAESYSGPLLSDIFNKLCFTVIVTTKEDDAFTFFDSQNTRGLRPDAIDVLKAIHLREIYNDTKLQLSCAQNWENEQKTDIKLLGLKSDIYLKTLIETLLWRNRAWKGASFETDSNYDKIKDEFDENMLLQKEHCNCITYYNQPSVFIQNTTNVVNNQNINETSAISENKKYLPFSLRQPLSKGVSFFAYITTYEKLLKTIFEDKVSENSELHEVRILFRCIYINSQCSQYMKIFFIQGLLFYYDKFAKNKILKFALLLDYLIGMHRINNYYFRKETMRNFIRNNNLFDAIQMSYLPEDVFKYMDNIHIDKRTLNKNNDPIEKYINGCISYFGNNCQFDDIVSNRNKLIKEKTDGKI